MNNIANQIGKENRQNKQHDTKGAQPRYQRDEIKQQKQRLVENATPKHEFFYIPLAEKDGKHLKQTTQRNKGGEDTGQAVGNTKLSS